MTRARASGPGLLRGGAAQRPVYLANGAKVVGEMGDAGDGAVQRDPFKIPGLRERLLPLPRVGAELLAEFDPLRLAEGWALPTGRPIGVSPGILSPDTHRFSSRRP